MGGITEIATSAPGYNSIRPNSRRAAGRDAQAQRLLDRAVRQVPRGAGLGDEPAGAVRRLADAAAAGSSTSTASSAARPTSTRRRSTTARSPIEPDRTPGGGLPLHRGHDRPRDRLGPPAEGADAGQAVLRLLRARRHARAAPRAARVVGQVQGPVRRGLGRAAGGDLRAPEGARRDPARGRADRPAGRDPGLGRHARRPQAGARAPDGGLRGLPGAHRPPRRPAGRRARRPRGPRRHADLLHRRRQRRLRGGNAAGHVQRDDLAQRGGGDRDDRVHGRADRPVRHDRGEQPLRGRLGARDGHPVPVDQAGGLALGRHAQRHRRALAERLRAPAARCAPSSAT